MKTYEEFINESNEDAISLSEVNDVIENIFSDNKVSSVNSVYEKQKDGNLKLVITINNMFYEKTNIIHNKIVFDTDKGKRGLIGNHFYYLYDLNCKFKKVMFSDTDDLSKKLSNVFNNKKFGEDLISLSDLAVTLNSRVNTWLVKNNIKNLSIYSITYSPIVDNVPCDAMTFTFDINIHDIRHIKMIVKKVSDNDFNVSFNEGDWFNDVNIDTLKALPKTIGKMIKNYIV